MLYKRFPHHTSKPGTANALIDIHLAKSLDISVSEELDCNNLYFVGGPMSSYDDLCRLRQTNTPFINIDKGYFRTKSTTHWRMSFNTLQQSQLLDVPADRLDSIAHFNMLPWQTNGDYILILAPNPMPLQLYEGHTDILRWCFETKTKILEYTDRKVFIRFKESVKARGNDSLSKYFDKCHAVVGLQSVGCVESICNGIPTYNMAPSCLDGLGNFSIADIACPIKADNRYEWLKSLAYSQFTIDEIEQGIAMRILKDLYNWS